MIFLALTDPRLCLFQGTDGTKILSGRFGLLLLFHQQQGFVRKESLPPKQKAVRPAWQTHMQIPQGRHVNDTGMMNQERVLHDHVDVLPVGLFGHGDIGRRG